MSELPNVQDGQATSGLQQMLTFYLQQDMYGLDISPIKEIIEFSQVTPVPMAPDYIRGVINIRGEVVPVLDLSIRFGGAAAEITKRSCIVITELPQEQGSVVVGLVIDSVSEVLDIEGTHIKPPPSFGAAIDSSFIAGMVQLDQQFVIVLNPARLLSDGEMQQIGQVTERSVA